MMVWSEGHFVIEFGEGCFTMGLYEGCLAKDLSEGSSMKDKFPKGQCRWNSIINISVHCNNFIKYIFHLRKSRERLRELFVFILLFS